MPSACRCCCRSCRASLLKRKRTVATPIDNTTIGSATMACDATAALLTVQEPAPPLPTASSASASDDFARHQQGLAEPAFEALLAELVDEAIAEEELESLIEHELQQAAAAPLPASPPALFAPITASAAIHTAPAMAGGMLASRGAPFMPALATSVQPAPACCGGECCVQCLWRKYGQAKQQLMHHVQLMQALGLLQCE